MSLTTRTHCILRRFALQRPKACNLLPIALKLPWYHFSRRTRPKLLYASIARSFCASSEPVVKNGDRVELHMKVIDPSKDQVVVETYGSGETVSFVVGQGQVIPGIEKACHGMKRGDVWTGIVKPEEGFGIRDPDKVFVMPIDRIPQEALENMKVGAVVSVEERKSIAKVVEINPKGVTLDENHEFAGKDLKFVIELVKIDRNPNTAWSSVQKQTLSPGDNRTFPRKGDRVKIHYEGSLATNGKLFDSSRKRNEPIQFQIGAGKVISGLETGITGLSIGERAKLFIPSAFGYGTVGMGDIIPPDSNLVFEIELLEINDSGS